MEILFRPRFIRQLNKLPTALQEEVFEKIELFRNSDNHRQLKVHRLHGKLKKYYSFSVNYRYRIVFEYLPNDTVGLIAIGDHAVYD